ncbi:LON peptidase N-terminal domain and RING finger protein 3-like [Actinia tenebrosa]|uniref:LON peptidase N-terminal domain and RING finger protein 3-like n=1 Tax=Actinia tenebrosa TaxID=6105 RepID=A0A6P8H7S8_ACTTE|nr:LON peptidase N-terminal domain and RING finger protein 3-like [Actinia tenebrosa]
MAEWMPTHKYDGSQWRQRDHENRPALLLEQCEEMARDGRLHEAFRLFSEAFNRGKFEKHQVKTLTAALVKFYNTKRIEQEMFQKSSKEKKRSEQSKNDMLTCSLCSSSFVEPITLPCGHTFCKFCLQDDFSSEVCTICGTTNNEELKAPTFLLCNIIFKWFPKKYELGLKKIEGRTSMVQGKYRQAIEVFSFILGEEPNDVNCLGWRAECYSCLEMLDLALKDIELARSLLPNSIRLLYSKSRILLRAGNREQSVFTLLQCAAIEPHNSKIQEELESGLFELFRLPDFSQIKGSVLPANFFTGERKTLSLMSNDCDFGATDNDVAMTECNLDDNSENNSFPSDKEDKMELKLSFEKKPTSTPSSTSTTDFDNTGQDTVVQVLQSNSESLLEDFECKLCCSLLYKPVTSPCGHNFCKDCLRRSLDFRVDCPCCRTPLNKYLAERRENVTVVLEIIIKELFSKEYEMRDKNYEQEMLALRRSVEDSEFEIPIFICTLAFPFVPCPLHIFEPQYKLMIRRCIESGSKQFGMCVINEDSSFPTIGTILKIKEVAYLQDGRSLINTIGTRRFQLISHYMKDGYNVAKVKWLIDEVEDDKEEAEEIKKLHANGFKMLEFWFNCLKSQQQKCIIDAIGSMPEKEEFNPSTNDQPSWLWWALAALPLQDKPKLIILAMPSVVERLRSIMRFLMLMIKMQQKSAKKE